MAEQSSQPVQRMSHSDTVTGVDAVDGSDGIDGMHTPNVEGVESAARGPYAGSRSSETHQVVLELVRLLTIGQERRGGFIS